MSGALGLVVVEQKTGASFSSLKNVTDIDEPDEVLSGMNTIITSGITCSSAAFILAGMSLLFGNLSYQEGFVQAFVWVTFVNVLVGYLLIIMVGFECIALEGCLIGHMDWLSSAAFLVAIFFYLTIIQVITNVINASLPTRWKLIYALTKEISWTGGNKFFKGILYCLSVWIYFVVVANSFVLSVVS